MSLAERMWRTPTAADEQQHKPVCAPGSSDFELLERFRQDLIRSRLVTPLPTALCQGTLCIVCRRQHFSTKHCTESSDTSPISMEAEPCINSRYVRSCCMWHDGLRRASLSCTHAFRCNTMFSVRHLQQCPSRAAALLSHCTLSCMHCPSPKGFTFFFNKN